MWYQEYEQAQFQIIHKYLDYLLSITGRSCIGNTFRPVYTHNGKEYTLSEEMITVLQNAAHQAVEELKAAQ